ncbi:MAG: hypothetical protein EZS28_008325 [Streblomastix strix]|uniref:Uncharacterized protein n=1 Tax=Streblomastix strix TaxID=222440 RepID=A0A5J4WNZ5_9EUKA|nr:MAG: hypothetical protein EZS28_008325 [Streblomastix strix]
MGFLLFVFGVVIAAGFKFQFDAAILPLALLLYALPFTPETEMPIELVGFDEFEGEDGFDPLLIFNVDFLVPDGELFTFDYYYYYYLDGDFPLAYEFNLTNLILDQDYQLEEEEEEEEEEDGDDPGFEIAEVIVGEKEIIGEDYGFVCNGEIEDQFDQQEEDPIEVKNEDYYYYEEEEELLLFVVDVTFPPNDIDKSDYWTNAIVSNSFLSVSD